MAINEQFRFSNGCSCCFGDPATRAMLPLVRYRLRGQERRSTDKVPNQHVQAPFLACVLERRRTSMPRGTLSGAWDIRALGRLLGEKHGR